MTDAITHPSPADKIVAEFIGHICSINPSFVEAVYLIGSLPMKDFYINKSDIDFLVLCKKMPDEKTVTQLKHIHKTIRKRYPKSDLSGSYLTTASIQTDAPENIKTLEYHEGIMRYGTFDMAPISLSELKSNALTVFGQEAETLQLDIKKEYLNQFLYSNINSYWLKWLDNHSSIFNRMLFLLFFPRLTEWSVLGVARQLCTLQTGKIVSKTQAGFYCLQQLPEKFHPIINEALGIREDNRTYPFGKSYAIRPSFKRLTQTIEYVNYIINTFNANYNGSHK